MPAPPSAVLQILRVVGSGKSCYGVLATQAMGPMPCVLWATVAPRRRGRASVGKSADPGPVFRSTTHRPAFAPPARLARARSGVAAMPCRLAMVVRRASAMGPAFEAGGRRRQVAMS